MWEGIEAVIKTVSSILDQIIPDKDERARAKEALKMAILQGDIQLALKQLEVNAAEASNTSVFVAGWRPWIGWVCGGALAYQYILYPFIHMILVACGYNADVLVSLDMMVLGPIVMGMLGLRTYEKSKGVATEYFNFRGRRNGSSVANAKDGGLPEPFSDK